MRIGRKKRKTTGEDREMRVTWEIYSVQCYLPKNLSGNAEEASRVCTLCIGCDFSHTTECIQWFLSLHYCTSTTTLSHSRERKWRETRTAFGEVLASTAVYIGSMVYSITTVSFYICSFPRLRLLVCNFLRHTRSQIFLAVFG